LCFCSEIDFSPQKNLSDFKSKEGTDVHVQDSVPRAEIAFMDARILELETSKTDDEKALDKLTQRLNAAAMENGSLQAAIQASTFCLAPV
jgi:prefoldin subunit 5